MTRTPPKPTAAVLERDAVAWDAYVAASSTPTHLQTTAWAEIKADNGWRAARAAIDLPAGPVGTQVLIARRRGLPWGMGYVPRGPVRSPGVTFDGAAIAALTARLRTVARQQRLGFVRIEPEMEAGGKTEAELRRAGWRPARHVQPEATRIIDLTAGEEAVRAGLHRKCRQSIAKSERLGVSIEPGDGSHLERFWAIHADALRRAGIVPRETRTYRRMWVALEPRGMARLWFARSAEGADVATLLLVSCGRRVVDLYGGTTPEGGRLRANYLLKWRAIQGCIADGLAEYDLWGLPREGIATFKSGFGGREVRYIGAWDLVTDRLGHAVLSRGAAALDRVRGWRRPGRGSSGTPGDEEASADD